MGRPAKLTWDNVYEGACRTGGHRYTPETTKVSNRADGRIMRECQVCHPPKTSQDEPSPLLGYWQRVAEGGRDALVKEVSARLDDLAGPYAVGVMPDDVFWAQFRAAFADRDLPFRSKGGDLIQP